MTAQQQTQLDLGFDVELVGCAVQPTEAGLEIDLSLPEAKGNHVGAPDGGGLEQLGAALLAVNKRGDQRDQQQRVREADDTEHGERPGPAVTELFESAAWSVPGERDQEGRSWGRSRLARPTMGARRASSLARG